jgi:hypothetical protein
MPSPVNVIQFMNSSYCLRPPTATRFFLVAAASSNDAPARALGVKARRCDGYDAAEVPVAVIDGKNL